jgi:hypothetical protein
MPDSTRKAALAVLVAQYTAAMEGVAMGHLPGDRVNLDDITLARMRRACAAARRRVAEEFRMDEDELVLPVLSIRSCELVVDLPEEYTTAFASFMPPRLTLEDARTYIDTVGFGVGIDVGIEWPDE